MRESVDTARSGRRRGVRLLLVALACVLAVGVVQTLPKTAHADEGNTEKMYRLYNQWSKEHFYTANTTEKANLVVQGWTSEGTAWNAPTDGDPVYRLYNPYTHEHLFTTNEGEYKGLDEAGWDGEGVVTHSAGEDGRAVYRLFNPWGKDGVSHLFTADANERDTLVGQGWQEEDGGWFALDTPIDRNLYLGSFFVDTPGQGPGYETVLCATRDGVNFTKVSTPFTSNENPFHDPSIMYKDGYFYMLSNMPLAAKPVKNNFYPMISYSKDLTTWTEPEGLSLINDGSYNGIPLESNPFGLSEVDDVAAEWFLDDNGDTYIIFSSGYYGAFHGQPENDRMKVYAVKVDLSNGGLTPWTADSGKPFPQGLKLGFSQAFEIKGLDASDNYIDASMYKENGTYYLVVKKDGVNNQIYANASMAPDGWHRVNDSIAIGNEGPSLAKVDDVYRIYTDQIETFHGRTGIQVSMATGVDQPFTAPQDVICQGVSGKLRHGTVIGLTGDAKTVGENFVSSVGL